MSLRERTRPGLGIGLGIIEPCPPSPAKAPPSGAGWLHEIKHDGFRIMARRDTNGVRLYTGLRTRTKQNPPSGASNRMTKQISGGVAHDLPPDLRKVLTSDPKALAAWKDLRLDQPFRRLKQALLHLTNADRECARTDQAPLDHQLAEEVALA